VSKLAVYVATTAGPVRIERIVREDAPLSQVYQGRAYRPLEPLSADYARFVAHAGPVTRALGPNPATSFRLEVSGPIGSGNSWEFGFLIAHALAATGQLAEPGEPALRVLLLTGLVDVDLRLGSVGHIADKIAAAEPLIAEMQKRGGTVTFFLPKEDLAAVAGRPQGLEVVAAETAREVMGAVGNLPAKLAPAPQGRAPLAALALGGAIALASLAAIGVDQYLKSAKPPASPARIAVVERHPPDGGTCAQVHLGKVEPKLSKVPTASDGTFATSRFTGLCGLAFSFDPPDRAARAAAWLEVLSGSYLEPAGSTRAIGAVVALDSAKPWVIDLPLRPKEPFAYWLVIGMANRPVETDLDWLRRQDDRDRGLEELKKRGLVLATARHRVEP
jgi:hypothetical protein